MPNNNNLSIICLIIIIYYFIYKIFNNNNSKNILYNQNNIIENADFETSSMLSSLNNILTKNTWDNQQIFKKPVISQQEILIVDDSLNSCGNCRALKHANSQNGSVLQINYNGDFTDGTLINGPRTNINNKLQISSLDNNTPVLCIGNTCIDENHLKILTGQKSIYISKPNDWNRYLASWEGELKYSKSGDSDKDKKIHGSWKISTNIPQQNLNCPDYTSNENCIS